MRVTTTFLHVFRWTARVLGALILTFVLLHMISDGLPNLQNIAPGETLLWSGLVLSLVGFALLWKWELTGGIVAIGGIALFYVVHFALVGKSG